MALSVVILAAGKGERMMSTRPKVMHEIMGKPMVGYVIERAQGLDPTNIVVVLGYGKETVEEYVRQFDVVCAYQQGQKGTAHALLSAETFVQDHDVLVLYGDVPLLEGQTLRNFLRYFQEASTICFLTTDVENPFGYGRVVMSEDRIEKIVEEADASPAEKTINRINTGICAIPQRFFALLREIKAENKKKEFYLTDICSVAVKKGIVVKGFHHGVPSEVLGVNSRRELLEANRIMKDRILDYHMQKGVTFLDRNIYVDEQVTIEGDTVISPNTFLQGRTRIGKDVFVGPNTVVKDCVIGDGARIDGFVFLRGTQIGPGITVHAGTSAAKGDSATGEESGKAVPPRRKKQCAE